MKKFIFLLLACLFVCGQAYGYSGKYASADNAVIPGMGMGPNGVTPFVEIIKVNVGSNTNSIAVGDVLVWNTDHAASTQADGYKVLECTVSDSARVATTNGFYPYAGVAIEVSSADAGTGGRSANSVAATGPTVVYMAIRGFTQALIDADKSYRGNPLRLNGGTLEGSFATVEGGAQGYASQDIGYLLDGMGGVDGVYNVWLR